MVECGEVGCEMKIPKKGGEGYDGSEVNAEAGCRGSG